MLKMEKKLYDIRNIVPFLLSQNYKQYVVIGRKKYYVNNGVQIRLDYINNIITILDKKGYFYDENTSFEESYLLKLHEIVNTPVIFS